MGEMLETQRLVLRQLEQSDFVALCAILQDIIVMAAWEHAFTDDEVKNWITEHQRRYKEDGIGYWAAIEKSSGELIGLIGPLLERLEIGNEFGVGYILRQSHWHKGYANEGADACIKYIFSHFDAKRVIADIRPSNFASRRVAEKLGMKEVGQCIKYYRGKAMPHLIYSLTRQEWEAGN